MDPSDPVHRGIVITVLSLAGLLSLAALITLLVRWTDLWLIPLAAATLAGSAWLITYVRSR